MLGYGPGPQIAGNTGFIRQATKTLTNAQIIALPTTPVEIIPAQGANKLIVPSVILAHMKWVADYGNIDASASVNIDITGNFVASLAENTLSGVTALLAGGGPDGTWVAFPLQLLAETTPTPANPTPHDHDTVCDSGFYDADLVNLPLKIYIENAGAGVLTGGNAGNALQVSVAYYILNTVTGLFE